MKRGEKASAVISIMESNRNKSYEDVSAMIELELGITNKAARAYYQYMVHNGKVTGITVTWGRGKRLGTPSVKPTAKAAKSATVKRMAKDLVESVKATNKATKKTKAKVEQTADEIAAIKAKNLETMQKVSAKLKSKKVRDFGDRVAKDDGEGVADFDPTLAREEIDSILRDERLIDVCPKFIREDA